MYRRRFLTAAALTVVAGCTGETDSGDASGTTSTTASPDNTPTPSSTDVATQTPSATPSSTPPPTETPTRQPSPTPVDQRARTEFPSFSWERLDGVDPVPTTTIEMRRFAFQPLVAAITPRTELTVVNQDSASHTFTAPSLETDETLTSDATRSLTYEQTGTFDYVCRFHPPGMVGRLVVTEDLPPTEA